MTAVCVYMYRQTDRLSGWDREIVPAHMLARVYVTFAHDVIVMGVSQKWS
jgi:hypothetical protein